MMSRDSLTEADLKLLLANMTRGKDVSPDGVKKHTGYGAGGGGAVTERHSANILLDGTMVKSSTRTFSGDQPKTGGTMRTLHRVIGLILLATMTACGSSGGDSSPPSTTAPNTAEGLWQGNSDTHRVIRTVVREDGTFLVFYSAVGASLHDHLSGMVVGDGTSVDGTFTSTNARDFNLEGFGVLDSTIAARYVARQSLDGQIVYDPATVVTFMSTFNPAFDVPSTLAEVAGVYEGQGGSVSVFFPALLSTTTVSISEHGEVAGRDVIGCAFSGQVTPHGSTFDLAVQFAVRFCQYPDQRFVGVMVLERSTHRLIAGALLNRNTAVLFEGERSSP